MHHKGAWDIREKKAFQQGRKKYRRDTRVCKALAACVEALSTEEDPARLGDRKYWRYAGTYGYNLSKSIRVIYKVDYGAHRVLLVAIGDHKEVYLSD